jgi:hypothetical protein
MMAEAFSTAYLWPRCLYRTVTHVHRIPAKLHLTWVTTGLVSTPTTSNLAVTVLVSPTPTEPTDGVTSKLPKLLSLRVILSD